MKKFILKIFGILAVIYIFEPFMVKRFDNMKREDNLKTPYDMKEDVMKEE